MEYAAVVRAAHDRYDVHADVYAGAYDAQVAPAWEALWQAIADDVGRAGALLDAAPDSAALLLDGVLRRAAECWYAARGWQAPAPAALLDDLAARDPALARRLCLALRAPHVRARYVHCAELCSALRRLLPAYEER